MDLTEALRSTGAVRDFRPDPVPDEVDEPEFDAEIIDLQKPSAAS